jgi:hypothetical protein
MKIISFRKKKIGEKYPYKVTRGDSLFGHNKFNLQNKRKEK